MKILKIFKAIIRRVIHLPWTAVKKYSIKKNRGILLCGKNLHDISKKANIQVNGVMMFNYKAFNSRTNKYEIGRIHIEDGASLSCGKQVSFHAGCKLAICGGAKLVIGDNTYVNMNTTLYCRNKISIGSRTAISQNVVIRDSDVHKIIGVNNNAPITIGDHCWIGTNVIILKGVTIGDNCVIGAGSVVTHDIPSNTVAVGNPAKVIKENIKWEA